MLLNFDKINKLAREQGKTLGSLSKEIGRSRYYLYNVRDRETAPKLLDVRRLADALHTTVEYLMDETNDPSAEPPEGFIPTENMRWNPNFDEEATAEAMATAARLATRPQGQILFSALKTASDEDIKKTIAILKALKGEE